MRTSRVEKREVRNRFAASVYRCSRSRGKHFTHATAAPFPLFKSTILDTIVASLPSLSPLGDLPCFRFAILGLVSAAASFYASEDWLWADCRCRACFKQKRPPPR